MITKFPIEDIVLITNLNENYEIRIVSLEFIPMGDSAYSYEVNCVNGHKYYLKLFDHQNDRQKKGIERLQAYLPLTWKIYHQGLFKNMTYPIKTQSGDYQSAFHGVTAVLFNFIEGESLADAYPFSDEILEAVAATAASIQQLTPHVDLTALPKESLDISFDSDLIQCMKVLELPPVINNPIHKEVREQVLAKKEQIHASLNLVYELRSTARLDPEQYVLCHGDIWGGNIIRHENQLYLIDWESVIVAPPEYNLFSYMGKGFDVFYSSYEKHLNKQITVNLDLLRFYSYRTHLRNLTNWLMNIVYRNHDKAQDENDLDMIRNHCLNRLDSIEPNVLAVEAFLQK